MELDSDNRFVKWFMSVINHYNHEKYWRRREIVVNPEKRVPKIIRLYFLFYIKRVDSFWHCSFGTSLLHGSRFATPPILWHGPNGIILGYNCVIGKNCIICQRVTMGHGKQIIVGDNVMIGSNAYISPGVHIGNNVKIGANCVVVEDIPDNATVVLQKPRIILK